VQFTILNGATKMYQETKIPTTDAYGVIIIIIINISEGIPYSSVFAAIHWRVMVI
jgi:hypothetical protein